MYSGPRDEFNVQVLRLLMVTISYFSYIRQFVQAGMLLHQLGPVSPGSGEVYCQGHRP